MNISKSDLHRQCLSQMANYYKLFIYYLVGGFTSSSKYESMWMLIPNILMDKMFQTTNQLFRAIFRTSPVAAPLQPLVSPAQLALCLGRCSLLIRHLPTWIPSTSPYHVEILHAYWHGIRYIMIWR